MSKLIRSFHFNTQAQIRLNDTTLEPIIINTECPMSSLTCSMAAMLFNLSHDSWLVIERWNVRVSGLEMMVCSYLKYKLDKKLFKECHEEMKTNECQFADDAARLSTTITGAEIATIE